MRDIVIEFEKVTKYPLVNFLYTYQEFMLNSYPEINRFFSGITPSIDNSHLTDLKKLTSECKKVLEYFKNFSNKFSNCGFWELMEMIDELNTAIEKINKLPKFKRTSLTKRGYQPVIQVETSVGSFRTFEDLANSVSEQNNDNSNWIDIMLNNDMEELDWEIDKLTGVKVFINNNVQVNVSTILDQPIGERIYGKDIAANISFDQNDLSIKMYRDNMEQKCNILLNLNRGDIPENKLLGKNLNLVNGVTSKGFAYPVLVQDLQNNFLQNDLFDSIDVTNFNFNGDAIEISVDIKSKYDYKTTKTVTV